MAEILRKEKYPSDLNDGERVVMDSLIPKAPAGGLRFRF